MKIYAQRLSKILHNPMNKQSKPRTNRKKDIKLLIFYSVLHMLIFDLFYDYVTKVGNMLLRSAFSRLSIFKKYKSILTVKMIA